MRRLVTRVGHTRHDGRYGVGPGASVCARAGGVARIVQSHP